MFREEIESYWKMEDARGNCQLAIFYQQINQSWCHQVSFDKISAIKVFLNFHLIEKVD
jgi:hypothetical protein